MKPSSRIALALAVVVVIATALLYRQARDVSAPPMNERTARALLDQGAQALHRRNVNGIMALLAPDAKVMGFNQDQLRLQLSKAMQETDPSSLDARFSSVQATDHGDTALVTFELSIGQQTQAMAASYYPHLKVILQLRKVREKRWLGLYTEEKWRITQADTDQPVEF